MYVQKSSLHQCPAAVCEYNKSQWFYTIKKFDGILE